MTILEKIINTVQTEGAITLQGIYQAHPEIKKDVIRGTINRYVRKDFGKLFDRCKRGLYVAIIQAEATVISLESNKMQKRRALINKLKSMSQKKKATEQLKVVGLNDYEGCDTDLTVETAQEYYIDELGFKSSSVSEVSITETIKQDKGEISKFINKVFNEDSRSLLGKLPSESVDLVITDPPYKVTKRGIGKRTNTGGMMRSELTSKGKIFEHNDIEPAEYIPELYRVLKEGTHCYIMTNHVNLKAMLDVAIECGFKFVKSLIWDKVNKIMGQFYMSQFEYILFFRKGKAKRINNCGTPDILRVPNKKTKDENGNNLHDTEKPVELAETLVLNSSNEGDITLDPFSGLGFVLKASLKNNRFTIGNEINPTYWNLCVEGMKNL